jgi:beta-galactosidase
VTGCSSNAARVSPRSDLILKTGWKFDRADPLGAEATAFDDSAWQRVEIPHTWNALDGQDGGNNYYRGPCWYRVHLPIDPSDLQKRLFLRFEGASLVAQVWVNGKFAGSHWNGFGAFCFDVSPLLQAGDNLLAVRVDNTHFTEVPPLSGDFTVFGGIYRNVHLLRLGPLNISPLDDASPGVYLRQVHVDDQSAQVEITAKLRNDLDSDQSVSVNFCVLDAGQHVVVEKTVAQTIPAHSTVDGKATVEISNPHLWDGRNDPYLYHATVELNQNGVLLDEVDQPLGLRYYRIDPNQGFFLNGRHYALHGVARHQDRIDMGWAAGPEQIEEDYRLIDEIGATTVRLAHYQHPDYEYSLCDRHGIVVWAESCLVNRISSEPEFAVNTKQELRELIKQSFNHPSIFFWSLYNELGPHTRTDWQLVKDLNELAHQLDPDRPTVAASHLPDNVAVNWIPDMIAFNRYFGWYVGTLADWPRELDKLHADHPDRAIGISEYGAGASVYQHQDRPTTRPADKGHWHPEEWQAIAHEAAWRAISRRPWIWGSYIWVMFDFPSDARDEGDHAGWNDKGLVTADRKVKKDAFYFYKANWSSDPFVYITSRRFNPRPPGATQLKVYSNCDSVRLTLNGTLLNGGSHLDHVFVWDNVDLPEGRCEVQAIGQKNGREYTDLCQWTVSAKATTGPAMEPAERK